MASPVVSINGRVVDAASAAVPALDRGLLYGDGVFEVLRTYGGVPFALEEHLGRLHASASRIGMTLPAPIARLRGEVAEALDAAGLPESHVRVLVTRGADDPGLAPTSPRDPTRMVVVTPLAPPPRERYASGARAVTVRVPWLPGPSPLSGAKTLNYLPNVLWTRDARARGVDEALIVAHGERVIEGASSNVFVVHGRDVATPPLADGCLPGITRAFVLKAAAAAGVAAREAPVTLADVWTADEVFVTSSVREVLPLVAVDDHEVGDGAPGAVTRALHRALRSLTPTPGAPMPWG